MLGTVDEHNKLATRMLGTVDEYNVEKESFDNYVERMEQFFEANAIAVDKRRTVFLAVYVL